MKQEVERALQTLTLLADNVALNKAQRDVVYGAIEVVRAALDKPDKKKMS